MDLSQNEQPATDTESRIGRKHPVAARILRRWRELTGGAAVRDEDRCTVVACSGGADSVALAVVMAMVDPKPLIAHITHDIRDAQSVEADRACVEMLAARLGCMFAHGSVRVLNQPGNLEENARDARYEALLTIASNAGCRYIATAHHADDQAETVLMNMIRGAGVRGLSGIPSTRSLGTVSVVRPALGVRRVELVEFCKDAGVGFQHDSTNDDLGLLRNRVRKELLPVLEAIRMDAIDRIGDAATNCDDAQSVIDRAVDAEWAAWTPADAGIERDRAGGRGIPAAVFDGVLRKFVTMYAQGVGLDTLSGRSVRAAHHGIVSESTEPRIYRVGAVVVGVTAHKIRLEVVPKEEPVSESKKVVVLVGHCGPDAFALQSAIRGFVAGADVRRVNDGEELAGMMSEVDLLVVNRVLDGRFDTESGIELIRGLGESDPAAMLITNFAEHMEEAIKAGAVPGFGKQTMRSAQAEAALLGALAMGERR
ncbi:MAG: tRNA lysidine(34) synthetase TilS [Phycisphaerales bacterium]|nr:tRNA lysidine(34) synthetase TilS [Phycisphaerales bacterium]